MMKMVGSHYVWINVLLKRDDLLRWISDYVRKKCTQIFPVREVGTRGKSKNSSFSGW